jgi:hypothetical protein
MVDREGKGGQEEQKELLSLRMLKPGEELISNYLQDNGRSIFLTLFQAP